MASGDTLAIFLPIQAEFPTTNAPTFVVRNNHLLLAFDSTTKETCYFRGLMPRHYAGTTGITVYIHYSMTSATTGDVDLDVAFERIGDQQQDLDSDGFAAANVVDTTTVPGTAGLVDIVSITFTDGADMDSIAVGEGFRMSAARDSPNDSAAGDLELFLIEIKET